MALTTSMRLVSGRTVELKMPNLYQVLASSRGLPNPALAAVLRLLDDEKSNPLVPPNELQQLQQARANIRGLYEIAALCLVSPQLLLEGTPGDGQIGPDDLAWVDLEQIYWRFFRTGPESVRDAAATQPVAAQDDTPDSGDLRTAAGGDLGGGSDGRSLAGILAGSGGALGGGDDAQGD